MKVDLVEYKFEDGQWTFRDSQMFDFYSRMDRVEDTFYNVVNADRLDPKVVLGYFRRCRFFMGFINGVMSGALWISGWNGLNKTGFLNFSWLKDAQWDGYEKIKACKEGVRILLDMPDFQLLYGETSISNVRTLALAKYFGYQFVGVIPHSHWDARSNCFEDTVFMWIDKDHLR